MAKRSEEVEALAKVLQRAYSDWLLCIEQGELFDVLARAAIAHLSKPKRGAKRRAH